MEMPVRPSRTGREEREAGPRIGPERPAPQPAGSQVRGGFLDPRRWEELPAPEQLGSERMGQLLELLEAREGRRGRLDRRRPGRWVVGQAAPHSRRRIWA